MYVDLVPHIPAPYNGRLCVPIYVLLPAGAWERIIEQARATRECWNGHGRGKSRVHGQRSSMACAVTVGYMLSEEYCNTSIEAVFLQTRKTLVFAINGNHRLFGWAYLRA